MISHRSLDFHQGQTGRFGLDM